MALASWAEEVGVERLLFVPGVEPHADLALAVVEPARDEVAGVRRQFDDVAVLGIARDGFDGAGVNPGMHAEERSGSFGFQENARS